MTAQSNHRVVADDGLNGYQRRRMETRRLLLEAGRSLFIEHGVEQVSIDAITSAAGVAKGSFYNHFDSREALFEELIEQTLANLLSKRRETQSEDLLEELHQGYAHAWSIFYTLLSDVEACKLLLQVGHTNSYAPIDKILHLALDEDLLFAFSHGTLAHLDRDLVLEAYFGAVTRGIGNLLTRADKIAPEMAADQLTQMCFAIMGLPHDPPPRFRETGQ